MAVREGEQVVVGGNEVYVSLCRRHWREEMRDVAPRAAPPPQQEALPSKLQASKVGTPPRGAGEKEESMQLDGGGGAAIGVVGGGGGDGGVESPK